MYCNPIGQNMYTFPPQDTYIPIPQANLPYMQQVPYMPQMPYMQRMPVQQPIQQVPVPQQPMLQQPAPQQPAATPQFVTPSGVSLPLMAGAQPPETPVMNKEFTQGYLSTQIGSKVRVEFLIGTNSLQDRRGTLVHVGISYIILLEEDTDDLLLCDIYSIKFVTFYK